MTTEHNLGDCPTDDMVREGEAADDALLASGKATSWDVCRIYGIRHISVAATVTLLNPKGFHESTELALNACGYHSLAHEPIITQLAEALARESAQEGRE